MIRPIQRARRRPHASRDGFTLLELMVALTAGITLITSIYFLSAASSRHFHEQQRVSQTQMALRMAMEQLRRDISRAGFLGTPNSAAEQVCRTPPMRVAAVDAFENNSSTALPNAAENRVSADRIVLTGNYLTSDAYLAIGFDATGSRVFLQTQWQAFRRSFGAPMREADFDAAFPTGRMLHIRTQQGRHFFVRITGRTAANASVTFEPSLGVGGACVVGLADGALVAPLTRVEYRVVDLTAQDEGASLRARGLPLANSVLVRRELLWDGTAVAASTRPVLEYVADFNLEFTADTQTNPGAPPVIRDFTGAAAPALVANTPHRIRAITVSLSARTPEQDPRFRWIQRAVGAPLTRYRVDPTLPGAARVRTMRAEIVLPNVANRVIRP